MEKNKSSKHNQELIKIDLDDRKKKILKAIIVEYIDTIEPVGSNTLLEKYDFNCSSATLRNEMAELEKDGFLEKTHTSSGRIPSNKGYQFYVDNLINDKNLSLKEVSYINSKLENTVSEMENLTQITTNTISEVTHYTTVSIGPDASNQLIQEFKFVLLGSRMLMAIIITESGVIKETIIKFDEDITQDQVNDISLLFNNKLKGKLLSEINIPMDQFIKKEMKLKIGVIKTIVDQINKAIAKETVYLKGADHALDNPEFQKNDLAKEFYSLLDNKQEISEILNNRQDFKVYIGNEENGLDGLSIVTFKNKVNGKDLGTIGIIGPTRMNYSKVISVLKYINQELNKGADIKKLSVPKNIVGEELKVTDGKEIENIKSSKKNPKEKRK